MSLFRNALIGVCTFALLAGCTTALGQREGTNSRPMNGKLYSPSARLYGDYLSASYADQLGDASARAQYYSRAFALKPEDLSLGKNALTAALSAGDQTLARVIAIEVHELDEQQEMAIAILGAHALAGGKYKLALEYLGSSSSAEEISHEVINSLIRGWAQVGLGNNEGALETFTQMDGGEYIQLIGGLQKAKLYAQIGDIENADKFFTQLDESGVSSIESVLSQVRSFVARGETENALTRLNEFTDRNGPALTGPVKSYIDALKMGEDIDTKLSPAQSASRALTETGFGYIAMRGQRKEQYEAAEIFLQLALELDSKNDKARLGLGSVLEDLDRNDDAMRAYRHIDGASPYTVSARLSEAGLLFDKDENKAALKTLEGIYKTHPSKITKTSLGRAHLIMDDYASALPYYESLIAGMSEEELIKNPTSRYIRGICLERLDRWQEAVVDFEFVLKHQPENSDALNYLGYTWVDKGVKLTKAFNMIRKAEALEPQSGAITDSLGWAHYKLGQYGEARVKLEDAVEYSPTSATIVDHLGDVYWKLGRVREAGYQWQRALILDPTDKEVRVIKAKLKGGLGAGRGVE